MFVGRKTRGLLEGCEIFSNKEEGVCVEGGAKPDIISSKIYESVKAGVVFKNLGSAGRLIGNEIHHNKGGGILVEVESTPGPLISANFVHDHALDFERLALGLNGFGLCFDHRGNAVVKEDNIFYAQRCGAGEGRALNARLNPGPGVDRDPGLSTTNGRRRTQESRRAQQALLN